MRNREQLFTVETVELTGYENLRKLVLEKTDCGHFYMHIINAENKRITERILIRKRDFSTLKCEIKKLDEKSLKNLFKSVDKHTPLCYNVLTVNNNNSPRKER